MVLLASCAQTTVSSASTPPPTLSPQARIYLTTALDIMQQHSVNRKKIDWTTLRRQTFALANGATTPEGTYLAIEAALAALNDHHSSFRTPNETAVYGSTGALTSNEKPHGQLLAHDIGYLELPTYNRVPTVPCAGYLGHPFTKLEDYSSSISFLSHCHHEERDVPAQKIESRQTNVQRIVTHIPRRPSRGMRRSPRFLQRKQGR